MHHLVPPHVGAGSKPFQQAQRSPFSPMGACSLLVTLFFPPSGSTIETEIAEAVVTTCLVDETAARAPDGEPIHSNWRQVYACVRRRPRYHHKHAPSLVGEGNITTGGDDEGSSV